MAGDSVTITGKVAAGKLVCDPLEWAIALQAFQDKPVTVKIARVKKQRTTKANRRYFGCLVPLAGHYLDNHETRRGLPPLSKLKVHGVLVSAFLGDEATALGPIPMETHTLDTKLFFGFTEKVERWLFDLGYRVPDGPEAAVEQQVEEAV